MHGIMFFQEKAFNGEANGDQSAIDESLYSRQL